MVVVPVMAVKQIMGMNMAVNTVPVVMDVFMDEIDLQQQSFILQNLICIADLFYPVIF